MELHLFGFHCHIVSRHYWLYLHLADAMWNVSRTYQRYSKIFQRVKSTSSGAKLHSTASDFQSLHQTTHHPAPALLCNFFNGKPSVDWELRVNGWLGGRLKWKDGLKVIRAKRRKGDPQRPAKPQSRRRFNEAHLTVIIHLQQINSGQADRQVPYQKVGSRPLAMRSAGKSINGKPLAHRKKTLSCNLKGCVSCPELLSSNYI